VYDGLPARHSGRTTLRSRQRGKEMLMDGSQFDIWTRRSFGLAAGGLAGSLLAVAGLDAEAKKKKKKKKCKKFGDSCSESGKNACCCGLTCRHPILDEVDGDEKQCCTAGGFPCDTDGECCSANCLGDFCFCKGNLQPCLEDFHCCSFHCVEDVCCPSEQACAPPR
jgi:hypothetical protein